MARMSQQEGLQSGFYGVGRLFIIHFRYEITEITPRKGQQ